MPSYVAMISSSLQAFGGDIITSLSEDSDAAKHANLIYEDVRDAVLRAGNWNFAEEYAQPATLATAPLFKWTKAFRLPTDPYCLKVKEVLSGDVPIDFKVQGRKLLTDYASINLIYTARITDPTVFDALFVQAYEARLSAELAFNISGDKGLFEAFWQIYQSKIAESWTIDSQEGSGDQLIFVDSMATARKR